MSIWLHNAQLINHNDFVSINLVHIPYMWEGL